MSNDSDRRHFIKSVTAGGTVALTSWPAFAVLKLEDSLAPGCRVFTVSQAALVGAIAEQIVPADDYPGAKEAGVVGFIDGILAGPFGKVYKERYQEGLRKVDEVSQARFAGNFASLSSDQQVSILKALESDNAENSIAHEFFGLIVQHTYEGYYGDPEHGGNRGGASWKMIGFEG